MTNHYVDMKNARVFLVFSNPAENHPACMQYVNEARFGPNQAKLIVVEPRRTRMASQADLFVRIRPGTDIALINGMVRETIRRQELNSGDAEFATKKMLTTHLTGTIARAWRTSTGATTASKSWPAYSDAPFVLNSSTSPTDYAREQKDFGSSVTVDNMPVVAGMAASFTGTPDLYGTTGQYTVYEYLKDWVAPYTPLQVAEICGLTVDKSADQSGTNPDLWTVPDFDLLCDMYFENSYCKTCATTPTDSDYKAGSILYAMGHTQHSKGSHVTRANCVLQVILGNMGKPGGGVNALRGIGNVQGSTDMGLLYGNTVAYNYGQPELADTHDQYMDRLFGEVHPEAAPNGVPLKFQQRGWHNMLYAWFTDGGSGKQAFSAIAGTQRPTVIKDGFTYKMWVYNGASIDYHTSTDGKTWSAATATTGLTGDSPCVVLDVEASVKTYYAFVGGSTDTTDPGNGIGIYTSTNGTAWTYKGEFVKSGTVGRFDELKTDCPTVAIEKSGTPTSYTFKMWYQGKMTGDTTQRRIGYATYTTTAPGTFPWAWTRVDGPGANKEVIPLGTGSDWDTDYVGQPSVVKNGNTYNMYYSGRTLGGLNKIGTATSTDGTNWTKKGIAIDESASSNSLWEPSVLLDSGVKVWFYRQAPGPAHSVQLWADTVAVDSASSLYKYYPKGNGLDHRSMFHQTKNDMPGYDSSKPDVKMMVVWGQNPRVTEANATKVEQGLYNLETLVCADIFLNETADVPRKDGSVTYFLPMASFAETYGSLTNSGRWIQWRNAAVAPKGNTKTDAEVLLRLAWELIDNDAIVKGTGGIWPAQNFEGTGGTNESNYDRLFGRYFLKADGTKLDAYNNVTGRVMTAFSYGESGDSKRIAGNVYKEFCAPLWGASDGARTWYGTMWIYDNAGAIALQQTAAGSRGTYVAAYEPDLTPAAYTAGTVPDGTKEGFVTLDHEGKAVAAAAFDGILAKSANMWDASAKLGVMPYFGHAWLLNRRIFYNNSYTVGDAKGGDVTDLFVAPDQVARLFVHYDTQEFGSTGNPSGRLGVVPYTWTYRKYSTFKDPDFRVPRHVEPWESPKLNAWFTSMALPVASGGLGKPVTPVGSAPTGVRNTAWLSEDLVADPAKGNFEFILTNFRHTEHYQGGQMSRNIPWLVELVPKAVVELSPADAAAIGVQSGDKVEIMTKRTDPSWIGPWVAVVGSGTGNTVKVAPGTVAIPWHWGNRGLATGPTANDLCIDANDKSTTMPESKACLCKIQKKV